MATPKDKWALRALDEAQRSMRLSPKVATAWLKRVRDERRAASRKGESRG